MQRHKQRHGVETCKVRCHKHARQVVKVRLTNGGVMVDCKVQDKHARQWHVRHERRHEVERHNVKM